MQLEHKDNVSPVLHDGIKNYLIDIDGTITEDVPNEQPERMATCEPFPDVWKPSTNGMTKAIRFAFSLREPKNTVR